MAMIWWACCCRRAAGEGEARDGSHAGQPFTAKTQRAHLFQVVQRGNLAGGVAVQRQRQVIRRNAAAVIGDADQLDAALGQVDGDLAGTGIQAVFQHFLQGRGGAFHHLASGDLVDQVIWELVNAFHRPSMIMPDWQEG
jgi:hypothetical protein